MKQTLVLLACCALLMPIVNAGSSAIPEIADGAGDQFPTAPGTPASFDRIDIVAAWVHAETNDHLEFVVQTQGDPNTDGLSGPSQFDFFMDYGGATFDAGALTGGGAEPSGDATASFLSGQEVHILIPRATFGDLVPGTLLTNMFVESAAPAAGNDPVPLSTDRAPDSGFGTDYVVGSQASADVDYDGDGIGDAQELQAGTDPTDPADPGAPAPPPTPPASPGNETGDDNSTAGGAANGTSGNQTTGNGTGDPANAGGADGNETGSSENSIGEDDGADAPAKKKTPFPALGAAVFLLLAARRRT